ncbi:MAG: hypothetical protein NTW38_06010 [Candidatus Aminicenantes bacterium]|nr:hypothetical protein [Candidatus Aminicenantes bacterium]
MRKRFFLGVALLAIIAGFAVMSFAEPQLQPPGQKHKLTLVNGTIMEGEIVAITAKTISIRDASLGVIAIARENILKIEPPLDEETGAAATPPPPAPTPRYADQPYAPANNGIKLGFSLSGGLGMINGGDFNQNIRDWNSYYNDYNSYWADYWDAAGRDYTDKYTADWKEMKSIPNFKGEVFARFGKNFGVGIGVEFIKKTNPGTVSYRWDAPRRYTYSWYYADITDKWDWTQDISQVLSVVPITLNLYYYLPISNKGEVYVNVGPGYYMGSIKGDYNTVYTGVYDWAYYYTSGTPFSYGYQDHYSEDYKSHFEGTCNTLGFHFGLGFNFNLGNNIALFGEALYRLANFKDWSGSGDEDWNSTETYGWTDESFTTLKDSGTDSWKGDYWYYEVYIKDYITQYYGRYDIFENEPKESSTWKNIRPAEFNINGISFRVGVKIFFDLNGRR